MKTDIMWTHRQIRKLKEIFKELDEKKKKEKEKEIKNER